MQSFTRAMSGESVGQFAPTAVPVGNGEAVIPTPPGGSSPNPPQPMGVDDKPQRGWLYGTGNGSAEAAATEIPRAEVQTTIAPVTPPTPSHVPAPPPSAPESRTETDQTLVLWHQNQALARDLEQAQVAQRNLHLLDNFFSQHPEMKTLVERAVRGEIPQEILHQIVNGQAPAPAPAVPGQQPQSAPVPVPTQQGRPVDVAAFRRDQETQNQLRQVRDEMASLRLEKQLMDMQNRYGQYFDPVETVAYARSIGIQDLEVAHRVRLGDLTLAQAQRQAQAPAPQQQQATAPPQAMPQQQHAAPQPVAPPPMMTQQQPQGFTNGPMRVGSQNMLPGRQYLPTGNVEMPGGRGAAPQSDPNAHPMTRGNRSYGAAARWAELMAGVR